MADDAREAGHDLHRRRFLKRVAAGSAVAWTAPLLHVGTALAQGSPGPGTTTTTTTTTLPLPPGYGNLVRPPDANGWLLPLGFTSRVLATSDVAVSGTAYIWPRDPDGGATFPSGDGGWIYVVNSETGSGGGGVSALRFDAAGAVTNAYRILGGTSRNCAGGPTPWGTWLSCEETVRGAVFECDPFGVVGAVRRDSLGWFNHEAAAVDPVAQVVYLTEDATDGGLYRFVPAAWPDLATGTLEVMTEVAGVLGWAAVPDPNPAPAGTATKDQVPTMKIFNGGEGAWFQGGDLYFTTKGDNRVWRYDPVANTLVVLSSPATNPELIGVDNITGIASAGDLYVAEDGGNMEVVMVDSAGEAAVIAQLDVAGSEITGVAFNPAGNRLYLSSQRNPGRTYEITGPFRT